MAIQQVDDFREEARDLAGLLAPLPDADWEQETTFKAWTINDVVQHLHFSDRMAFLSATDEDAYHKFRGDLTAARVWLCIVPPFSRAAVKSPRNL